MKNSVYMTWAKHQVATRYNLANSGILGCSLADLPITVDDIAINGPNHEGYAPLKEAIAAKYDVCAWASRHGAGHVDGQLLGDGDGDRTWR